MAEADDGRIRLVVLNFNGGELTARCLRAIRELDWPADQIDLVVIDNASTDGSREAIETEFRDLRLIRNSVNTGFTANNLGLTELSDIGYVGLINNDAFVARGYLRPLVEALDADVGLGAVSPKMVFEPRFVDVTIESPTFVPGVGDSRELGAMISGLRIDGADRWRDAQFAEGAYGIEHGRGGTFQWTGSRAVLRVPTASEGRSPASAVGLRSSVEILVEAEIPKKITFTSGSKECAVEVGTTPLWVKVEIDGESYDVIQNAGSIVFEDGAGADRGYLEPDLGQYDQSVDLFNWCGGAVLMRPAYLEQVGLLDERFFLYYEDTDLSWRGRAQGWRYQYVPESVIRHVHAATTGEGSPMFTFHVERNRLLMLVKNAPAGLALRQIARFVLSTASYGRRDIASPILRRRRPNVVTVRRRLKAFLGFLRLLPAMLQQRRQLRRVQTVPDSELLEWLVKR